MVTMFGTIPIMMNALKMMSANQASCFPEDLKPERRNVILMYRRMAKASLCTLCTWGAYLSKVGDLCGQKGKLESVE